MKRWRKITLGLCCLLIAGYVVRLKINASSSLEVETEESEEGRRLTLATAKKALEGVAEGLVAEAQKTMLQRMERGAAAVQQGKVSLRADDPAQSNNLRDREQQYLQNRRNVSYGTFERMFGANVLSGNKQNIPGIAVAIAGQGFPGMVWSLGYLQALEQMGLLDTVQYIASGSTTSWLLSSWIMSDRSLQETGYDVLKFVENNLLIDLANVSIDTNQIANRIKQEVQSFVFDMVWPQFWFDMQVSENSLKLSTKNLKDTLAELVTQTKITEVDFIGMVPLTALFEKIQPQHRYATTLGSQFEHVQSGKKPFPIYTAITGGGWNSMWWEFSPLEVRNVQSEVVPWSFSMPEWAFGRTWDGGVTKPLQQIHQLGAEEAQSVKIDLYPPQIKLATLLGMFGSSLHVDVVKLLQAVAAELYSRQFQDKTEQLGAVFVRTALDKMVKDFAKEHALNRKFSKNYSLSVGNPFANYTEVPLLMGTTLLFKDSAEAYPIPALPLLRPDRKLSLVLICETPDEKKGSAIDAFIADAAKMGITYQRKVRTATGQQIGNSSCAVYEDVNRQAPRILHIKFPHVKDPSKINIGIDDTLMTAAGKLAKQDPHFKALYDRVIPRIGKIPLYTKNLYTAYTPRTYEEQIDYAQFLVWANWYVIEDQLADVMIERGIGFKQDYAKKLKDKESLLEHGGIIF